MIAFWGGIPTNPFTLLPCSTLFPFFLIVYVSCGLLQLWTEVVTLRLLKFNRRMARWVFQSQAVTWQWVMFYIQRGTSHALLYTCWTPLTGSGG